MKVGAVEGYGSIEEAVAAGATRPINEPRASQKKEIFILVALSNRRQTFLITRYLEKKGYPVIGITRRDLFFPAFQAGQQRYNLVITDDHRRNVQFVNHLKAVSPHTPILLLSKDDSTIGKGKADDSLTEHFIWYQLQEKVNALLGIEE